MSFPTTPVLDDFNRPDEQLSDSANWIPNGVTTDPSVVSDQLVSLGSGQTWDAWHTLYAMPAEAFVTVTAIDDPTDFTFGFALKIFLQETEVEAWGYDQDYTGYILLLYPSADGDGAPGTYILGYGGNWGDGKTVNEFATGTVTVNVGDQFGLSVAEHPSDSSMVRMTAWQNGTSFATFDETKVELQTIFPSPGRYDHGYITAAVFSSGYALDDFGGGNSVAAGSVTVNAVVASAPAAVPSVLTKASMVVPAGSAPATAPVPSAKILLSPPTSAAGPTTVTPPSLTISSSAAPAPAASAPAAIPVPGVTVAMVVPAASAPASAPVSVPLTALTMVTPAAPATVPVPAVSNSGTAVTLAVSASSATGTAPVPAPTTALTAPASSAPASGTVTVNPEADPPTASAPASAPIPAVTYTATVTAVTASAPASVPASAPTVSLAPPVVTAPASIPTVVFNLKIVPPRASAPASAPVPVIGNVGAGVTLNIPAASAPATGRVPVPKLGPNAVTASAVPTGGVPTQVGHFLRLDSATETVELATAASTGTLVLVPAAHADL